MTKPAEFRDSVRSLLSALALSLATLGAASPAWAGTWIVDDSGGPGVHYTSIGAAIAAASAGDRIFVRAGNYDSFTLDKPLVVRGESGVIVQDNCLIEAIPAGSDTVLSTCRMPGLIVRHCQGAVLLEALTIRGPSSGSWDLLKVYSCSDVRLRDCSILGDSWHDPNTYGGSPALSADNSRVEVVDSTLWGGVGHGEGMCGGVGAGGCGLDCGDGSRVHSVLTSMAGGDGGYLESCAWANHSGAGGHGAYVAPLGQLILAGNTSNQIRGGSAGGTAWGPGCGQVGPGRGGDGLLADGWVRYSGVTFFGGSFGCSGGSTIRIGSWGQALLAVPDDPTLALNGPVPGATLAVELRAPAGSAARLWLGRTMLVRPTSGIEIERLTSPLRTYTLGNVPASGALATIVSLPPLPSGYILVAQSDVVLANGETRRTNSLTMTIR